jgi:hypothetical protein
MQKPANAVKIARMLQKRNVEEVGGRLDDGAMLEKPMLNRVLRY